MLFESQEIILLESHLTLMNLRLKPKLKKSHFAATSTIFYVEECFRRHLR